MTRGERFGPFPAAGAVVALFGGNALVAGLFHARQAVVAALQLSLVAVFIAYCGSTSKMTRQRPANGTRRS